MVAVFVGEEDGRDFPRRNPGQGEALEGFTCAQSRVEEDRASVRPQDCRVAAAPAAKHDKFHAKDAIGTDGAGQTGSEFPSWPNPLPLL